MTSEICPPTPNSVTNGTLKVDASSVKEAVIVMTRMFDAPRDVVWTIFTTAEHVGKWYGGHGFTSPVCEMDVRPGGLWKHVMRAPNGMEFAINSVFVEVKKPEKLVWKGADAQKPGMPPSPVNTVTLEDHGAQTKWTLVARFETVADRDAAAQMGFAEMVREGSEKLNEIARSLA